MNKEGKTIEELLKEYYNRPLELIEENKKLKKKIDKLQKENAELKEELFVERKTHISKYAIRNKIKEIEEDADFQAIEVLYELLEEKTNE